MSFHIPPDLLLVLVRPDSTFDERRAAVQELAEAAWSRGWEDCAETYEHALDSALPPGTTVNIPKPAARRLS